MSKKFGILILESQKKLVEKNYCLKERILQFTTLINKSPYAELNFT